MNFYTNFAPDNVLIRTRRNVVEHKYNVRPVFIFHPLIVVLLCLKM